MGLPPALQQQLESSGIDKQTISQHPEQVLQVLSFASQQAARSQNMVPPTP